MFSEFLYFCIALKFFKMNTVQFFLIMFLATVKTLLSPPVAYMSGLSFWPTFIAISCGGIIGFLVTFLITNWLMRLWAKKNPSYKNLRKAKKIVNLRKKYKLGVFLFILPFFSVPVMAYVVRKFFGNSKKIILLSCLIIVFWCLVFSMIYLPIQRL